MRPELATAAWPSARASSGWTPTSRDARDYLPPFPSARRAAASLAGVTSVHRCAPRSSTGFVRRRRRVYVPPTMAVAQALRTVVNGPLGDLVVGRSARVSVPAMEDQIRSLGHGFGRSTAR